MASALGLFSLFLLPMHPATLRRAPSSTEPDDVPLRLFCSSNERFVLSMAVMLHSALTNLTTVQDVEIVIADTGLSDESYQKLRALVHRAPVSVSLQFRKPDVDSLDGMRTTDWHRLPIYFRLLVEQIVPPSWDRLLYLDSDVLVRSDLGRLWRTPLDGALSLGVVDFRVPTVWERNELRDVYVNALGLPPDTPYCNSGMMLLNLKRWRDEAIGQRCLRFLREHPKHTYYPDQDAINAIFRGDWKLIDPRWNVALSAVPYLGYPEHHTPAMRAEQEELLADPHIVHYTGPSKPWHHTYRRSYSRLFLDTLNQSGWLTGAGGWWWTASRRVTHTCMRQASRNVVPVVRSASERVQQMWARETAATGGEW